MCDGSSMRRHARSTARRATIWSTEDAPLRPLTPYAESKVRVEDDVAAMADDSLHAGVPAQRNGFRVLATTARRHRAEQPRRSRGAHRRRPRALGRHAVATAGARPRHRRRRSSPRSRRRSTSVHCHAYNVGTESNNLTVAEIAQTVVDVVPARSLLITGETGPDPRSYRVDFSAFRNALGFEAAWSIPDGAAELYERIHLGRADRRRLREEVHPAAASGSASRQRHPR